MITVRRRAIELARQDYDTTPVKQFDTPLRSKVEADAHLAIFSSQYIAAVAADTGRAEVFLNHFQDMLGKQSVGHPRKVNTSLARPTVIGTFTGAYGTVMQPKAEIEGRLAETRAGQKAVEACANFVAVADETVGLHTAPDAAAIEWAPLSIYATYRDPIEIITIGNRTLRVMGSLALQGMYEDLQQGKKLPLDQRLGYLHATKKRIMQAGSLSMDQFNGYRGPGKPGQPQATIAHGMVDVMPEPDLARRQLEHLHDQGPILRGRNMCGALPVLPQTEHTPGGSTLAMAWGLLVQTMGQANVHALDSDAPEHAVLPKHSAR